MLRPAADENFNGDIVRGLLRRNPTLDIVRVQAGLGLYGVTAYAVARRRTEIGIRMALGAVQANVVRLVVSRLARLVSIGVVAGTAASLWLSRFVASLLYGLEPGDPMSLLGAVVVLGAVGMTAALLPAVRASRIDPAAVLRES
jgi:ABC-type antimicrobial peptide transport system permease subunit